MIYDIKNKIYYANLKYRDNAENIKFIYLVILIDAED